MDEARTVIRRLERIEALRCSRAPAEELLGEVRQLLAEGEAWIAAERPAGPRNGEGVAAAGSGGIEDAAAAIADCRKRLSGGREVMPGTTGGRDL